MSGSALLRHALLVGLGLWPWVGAAEAQGPREGLDDHLAGLVARMRSSLPDLGRYEPLLVLYVLHDEGGYRVNASDLLERRLAGVLARQGIRVIDQVVRQRMLDQLDACYRDEAPFCRASEVVGRFRTAGGVLEGTVLPVRDGVQVRVKLVAGVGGADVSPGEILGSWTVTVPPPTLDPDADLAASSGAVAYGGVPHGAGDALSPTPVGQLRVVVETEDASPAWVRIDGEVVVPAPVTTTIRAGRHLLTVTASGHRPYSDYVNVPARGLAPVHVRLERGRGRVEVTANAEGAHVFIDGRRVGSTPWLGEEIEAGGHRLRVEKRGFDAFETDFVLEHQEVKRLHTTLQEHPGDIVVTCLHDDVMVYLDKEGKKPAGICSTGRSLTLRAVPAGRHRVWGVRGSQRSKIHVVRVRGDEAVPLNLALILEEDERDAGKNGAEEQKGSEGRRGPRRHEGSHVAVGYIWGRAEWGMTLADVAGTFSTAGSGFRVAASYYRDAWEIAFGADFVSFDQIEVFEGESGYFEVFVDVSRRFFPRSPLQPFLGVRGHYNSVSFQDASGAGTSDVYSHDLGIGALGGLDVIVTPGLSLELGAAYSWSGGRNVTVKRIDLGLIEPELAGEVEKWRWLSVDAALKVHVSSGTKRRGGSRDQGGVW